MARGRMRESERACDKKQRLRKWSALFAVKLLIFLTVEAECEWKWWPVFCIQINSVLILELFMKAIWANLSTCERSHVYGCCVYSSAKNMNAWLFFIFLWRFISLSNHIRPVQNYYLFQRSIFIRIFLLLSFVIIIISIIDNKFVRYSFYLYALSEWQWSQNV